MPAGGLPKVGEYKARDDADAAEQQGGAKYHLGHRQSEQNCCKPREQRRPDEAVAHRPWAVPLPEDADEEPGSQKGCEQELIPTSDLHLWTRHVDLRSGPRRNRNQPTSLEASFWRQTFTQEHAEKYDSRVTLLSDLLTAPDRAGQP